MAEKSEKNIRFDAHRYPDRANYILKQIKDALDDPHTEYEIEPSSDMKANAFAVVTGKMINGKTFRVEHITPKNQSQKEQLYVIYDNIEFLADWGFMGLKINIVGLLDSFINQEYVYDMNRNRYVGLPKEVRFVDKLDTMLGRLSFGRRNKKQK